LRSVAIPYVDDPASPKTEKVTQLVRSPEKADYRSGLSNPLEAGHELSNRVEQNACDGANART
jgi:hypothetical protein